MSTPEICGYDGRAGKAGDGAEIRIYTESECTKKGGVWHQNGECTYPDGKSISWDCREVNNDPIAKLYENRYIIGGVVVVGGLLAWRMSMRR
jgi:hypothetical protein